MGSDHLDALWAQVFVKRITVVGAVSDEVLRFGLDHVKVEAELHQAHFVMVRSMGGPIHEDAVPLGGGSKAKWATTPWTELTPRPVHRQIEAERQALSRARGKGLEGLPDAWRSWRRTWGRAEWKLSPWRWAIELRKLIRRLGSLTCASRVKNCVLTNGNWRRLVIISLSVNGNARIRFAATATRPLSRI
jgi:hypothetical protein